MKNVKLYEEIAIIKKEIAIFDKNKSKNTLIIMVTGKTIRTEG